MRIPISSRDPSAARAKIRATGEICSTTARVATNDTPQNDDGEQDAQAWVAIGTSLLNSGMLLSVGRKAVTTPLLPLFDSGETVLADDALGRIVYTPGFVAGATPGPGSRSCAKEVTWQAERRQMYDREVDVPRLTGAFPAADEPDPAIPPAILQAAAQVIPRTGVPFNSVGLNFYRDGRTAWLRTTTTST